MSKTNNHVVIPYDKDAEHLKALRELVDRAGPIDPVSRTKRDSAVLYGVIATASTACMFLSGYFDTLSVGADAQHNFLRMAQGVGATCNVLLTAFLSLVGRHQTYTDLADVQKRVPQDQIVARADTSKKSKIERAFDWTLKNAFNINAWVSLPLCALMFTSGIMSGRPGEAITAAMFVPVYIAQLFPERYGNAVTVDQDAKPKKKGIIQKLLDFGTAAENLVRRVPIVRSMPPLLLSSAVATARLLPMAANAVLKGDLFQLGQYGLSIVMYIFKANTTKDGIGRLGGSLASPDTPNALAVTDTLLNGREMSLLARKARSHMNELAGRAEKKWLSDMQVRLDG